MSGRGELAASLRFRAGRAGRAGARGAAGEASPLAKADGRVRGERRRAAFCVQPENYKPHGALRQATPPLRFGKGEMTVDVYREPSAMHIRRGGVGSRP